MTKFVFDSSCDLLYMDGIEFSSVPLTISSDDFSFTDDASLNTDELIETMEKYKGRSFTACPSIDKWLQAFEGGDEIFVGTLTSGLSGTYNSAMNARELYLQEHPNAQIHVFDSLTTGPELRLLLEKLVELKKEGLSFHEICQKGEAYLKTTHLFFAFQSLHNFAQNGRINKALAAAISLLNISILGTANEEGKVEPIEKCRTKKKMISSLLTELKKVHYNGGRLRICHIKNEPLALEIIESIKKEFSTSDVLCYEARGICSYYGERGGIILGIECTP